MTWFFFFPLFALAALGIATGAVLLLCAWVTAMFCAVESITERSWSAGGWSDAGRLAVAGLISLTLGGTAALVLHGLRLAGGGQV